jgi:hypothetical protein
MRTTILGGALALILAAGCTGSAVITKGDASTDLAESIRGAAHLASVSTDRSGEHAEAVRGAAVLLGAIDDNSYDAVERSRARVTS